MILSSGHGGARCFNAGRLKNVVMIVSSDASSKYLQYISVYFLIRQVWFLIMVSEIKY